VYDSRWYRSSPIPVQNALCTVAGAASRVLRGGREFQRHLAELRDSQWLDAAQLRALQDAKVERLIRHCYARVPYYRDVMRERGLTPRDIQTAEDLRKLPYLTKEIVRTQGHRLVREDIGRLGVYHSKTSGTSGTPLRLVRDTLSVNYENATLWWVWTTAGLPLWGRRATLRGDLIVPPEQRRPPYWRLNRAERQLLLSGVHLSRESVPFYLDALERYRPIAIETYATAAFYLARSAVETGRKVHVDAVLTGSEPHYPHMRRAIEEAFSCTVHDYYGQAERVAFAAECERHDGLHLAMAYGAVEFAEPEGPAPAGLREIVGTSLNNDAMPFVRYRTGDLARTIDAPCPCGRTLPRIAGIETRAGDVISTPDGRRISYLHLTRVFGLFEHIKKSQVVQDGPDHFTVKIVLDETFSDEDRRKMVAGIREMLSFDASVDIVRVDDIPTEPSGKFRWFVSALGDRDARMSRPADER